MASITSLSNSSYNTSSIYGNRNVLSGLASGMDTESMIENAISGFKTKINALGQKRTKVEWQQEAYRSIIDKAVNFNTKYTSYSSKTNLLSASFFNSAVNTTVNGTWKDKITASGKTSSDIKINAVKQMAKAATYTTSGLGGKFKGEINGIEGAKGLDLNESMDVSNISGSLSIQYGSGKQGASFTISFDELDDIVGSGQELADAINEKLADVTYTYTKNGFQETTTADKAVQAVYMGGEIVFKDVLGNGNKVSIGGVSGDMEDTLGISAGDTSISVNYDTKWSSSKTTAEYLEGKELGVTYNGTTKKISMSDVMNRIDFSYDAAEDKGTQFKKALQAELDDAFDLRETAVEEDGTRLLERYNSSGARVTGFNVEAKAAFTRWFQLQAGITWQRSRYKEPQYWSDDETVAPERRMFRTPRSLRLLDRFGRHYAQLSRIALRQLHGTNARAAQRGMDRTRHRPPDARILGHGVTLLLSVPPDERNLDAARRGREEHLRQLPERPRLRAVERLGIHLRPIAASNIFRGTEIHHGRHKLSSAAATVAEDMFTLRPTTARAVRIPYYI